MGWHGINTIGARRYCCGYCGANVASDKGYFRDKSQARIYACPNCTAPSYFDNSGLQTPGFPIGNEVMHLPGDLESLYREARKACSVSAYTAAVLACRKLLMNIAVQQGAKEGLKFIEYVDYLADKGFIPPNGRAWVDHIRKRGNEATHEIALMSADDASELISFSEMLLKFIFEFPSRVPRT